MTNEEIENKIKNLPDHLLIEVADYVDFLMSKYGTGGEVRGKKLTFEWEGELSHLSDKYTSIELQHKSIECR